MSNVSEIDVPRVQKNHNFLALMRSQNLDSAVESSVGMPCPREKTQKTVSRILYSNAAVPEHCFRHPEKDRIHKPCKLFWTEVPRLLREPVHPGTKNRGSEDIMLLVVHTQKLVKGDIKEPGDLLDGKNVWVIFISFPFRDSLWAHLHTVGQIELLEIEFVP